MIYPRLLPVHMLLALTLIVSCRSRNSVPSKELIDQIKLKRGTVISCGPPDQQFGTVEFEIILQ